MERKDDFSRRRELGFTSTALMILHLFKESVAFNLVKVLPKVGCRKVSESAFTQARYKIKWEFFRQLTTLLHSHYLNGARKLWKGMTVIGVDGSTISLRNTKEIREKFGVFIQTDTGITRILARVILFYDVLNNYVFEGTLTPLSIGEQQLVEQSSQGHAPSGKKIYAYDRGFGSRQFIQTLVEKGGLFCVRMSLNAKIIKEFAQGQTNDWVGDWYITGKNREKAKLNGREVKLFKIRLIKITLSSGETEVLATNLFDQQTFTVEDMGELYHKRWGVEEGFKKLKAYIKIEHFGCGKVAGVYQEFHTHLFYMNLISILGMEAQLEVEQKCKNRRYAYQYNWKNAYRFVREYIVDIIWGYKRRDRLLDHIIELISSSVTAIIPGRKFGREPMKGKRSFIYK